MRKIDLGRFQIATSETARDINRRIILDLIRTRQPVSRADLARFTGLQRSTVSIITDQLINEHWVTEGALGHLPRGRKPRFLHLNSERAGIVGVDLRPHMTSVALTDMRARFLSQESFETPSAPRILIDELVERINKMRKAYPQIFFEGIGVSLPGRVDRRSQRLIFAPNLGWEEVGGERSGGVELKQPLETATGLPVEVDNAANSCALYEAWFGIKSDGTNYLIALTVSEGIGTGIIEDGQLLYGPTGMAGEFGHVSLNEDGPRCSCGNSGCWEVYGSNTAAVNYYVRALSSSLDNQPPRTGLEISFDDLLQFCEQGDEQAIRAIERMAHYLGQGISMLVTGFAPSLIVVVGAITRQWEKVGPIIQSIVMEKSPHATKTRIIPLNEFEQPRLRGAIALVLQKHFVAPNVA